MMAPPVKMDKSVAAFLKKNLEPDEELVAYVYGRELHFLFAWLPMRFLMVTNRRVILTKSGGFSVAEPTRVVESAPRDQVKLEVVKTGSISTKLRIHFPGAPQIRLRVFKRFVPAGVDPA
jgi:hypothetical protein